MFFKKDTFIDDQIALLKKNAAELERWATSNPITEAEYRARRCSEINLPAIKALMGMEIKDKDGKLKQSRTHKGPTQEQVFEVSRVIENLVNGIEKTAREAFENAKSTDDDKGVPIEYRVSSNVGELKLDGKAKEIRDQILGDSAESIARSYFTSFDCQKIQIAGQKIRKAGNIKTAFIIGGIVLVVAAGVLTAIYIWHKKQKDSEPVLDTVGDDIDRMEEAADALTDRMEDTDHLVGD